MDPSFGPSQDVVMPRSDGADDSQRAGRQDEVEADPVVRRLSAAVDGLTDLSSQPIDVHAARYREVHNVLQDALSDTDRGGSQST